MAPIPEAYLDLLTDKITFAHLATVSEQCIPQVTPVWFEYDGTYILVNSARGRRKDRNIRANPNVALSIQDPDNPYRYVGIQGKVVEITEEGAVEHIHKLSRKYTGQDYRWMQPGEIRVIYRIEPVRVWGMG